MKTDDLDVKDEIFYLAIIKMKAVHPELASTQFPSLNSSTEGSALRPLTSHLRLSLLGVQCELIRRDGGSALQQQQCWLRGAAES